ncbi:HAMP domain-containing sensor histidine kinase [Prosthecobacter sp.]|uniref:sensor histidine kinase n=1 Tax=Prosthecobacter sp. TaxID=1965333 RepID=UPI002AB81113|nr:HAMP domain-containing sensor histidine kinase [Prosthecobacter sp.]MDZ4403755.1 HAMP domain-containing sensor histidine kinase [Prosthecobacter sp.]
MIKSWRFGLGFLAFVVAGSLLLLAWLRQREREESNRLFHALVQADAEFVRRMNLPRSEKLAGDLEQLLGMRIKFSDMGKGVTKDDDTLVVRLDDKNDMIFTRKPVASQLSLRDPATRNAFIAFWLVSGIVGWLLARERLKRAQSERLAMLGRVATSLAHDIKNPLASIQLHAQLMTPSDGEDAKALKMIESESEVIAGLVNQWLHLANPLPPKLVKLDVAECIVAVTRNLQAQAQHAAVDIENGLTSPIWVMGDAQRLSQAFRNFLVNGIQAMPRGGKLRISAERHENMISLRFADSGPGFSESALARGTELFFTEKEGGMGVGLNIVASIVEAHGGRLELQNDPKGGAVIIVSLPSLAA